MTKATLEWITGEHTWRNVKIDEHYSGKGYYSVKHGEKVYSYKARKVGNTVMELVDGKWVEAGRIDISGKIFIGGKDEMSYAEYRKTPEGREEAKQLFEDFRRRH